MFTTEIAQTNSAAPPSAMTDAPGESNCTSCHSSFSLNSGPGTVQMIVGDGVDHYKPDSSYDVTVTVNHPGAVIFGFEATAIDKDELAIGTFTNIANQGTGISSSTSSGTKRFYVGHRNASSKNIWAFKWRAPAGNAGPVSLYVIGNAGNDNGSTLGDFIYSSNVSLTQDSIPLGISDNLNNSKFVSIFPNPSKGEINISSMNSKILHLDIYDVNGKIVSNNSLLEISNKQKLNLPKGLYFIQVKTEEGSTMKKVFVN